MLDHNNVTDRRAAENFKCYNATNIADCVTDEIHIEPKNKTLQISTPRSAVVSFPVGRNANRILKVKNSDTFQTFVDNFKYPGGIAGYHFTRK